MISDVINPVAVAFGQRTALATERAAQNQAQHQKFNGFHHIQPHLRLGQTQSELQFSAVKRLPAQTQDVWSSTTSSTSKKSAKHTGRNRNQVFQRAAETACPKQSSYRFISSRLSV
jgi:hypothetical protein